MDPQAHESNLAAVQVFDQTTTETRSLGIERRTGRRDQSEEQAQTEGREEETEKPGGLPLRHPTVRRFVEVEPGSRLPTDAVLSQLKNTATRFSWTFFDRKREFITTADQRGQKLMIVESIGDDEGSGKDAQFIMALEVSPLRALLTTESSAAEKAIAEHTLSIMVSINSPVDGWVLTWPDG
jgi:hypothetical protein